MNFITRKLLITFLGLSLVGSPASAMDQEIISCKNMSKEDLIMGIKELPRELKLYIISLLLQRSLGFNFKPSKFFKIGNNNPTCLAFSPDGRDVLIGFLYKIVLLNIPTNEIKPLTPFKEDSEIISVACGNGGDVCLIGLENGITWIVNPKTKEKIAILKGHTQSIQSVALSTDEKRCLTGSDDATACLWNVTTGELITTFSGHTDSIFSLAFSPDEETVLTGSRDNTACLWNTKTGERLLTLEKHTGYIFSVAFSPEGHTCCTGSTDGTACLWNSETGQLLQTLKGHTDSIIAVAFSPDGKRVITGSEDGMIGGIWSCKTGERVAKFREPDDCICSIAFSPQADTCITVSADGEYEEEDGSVGTRIGKLIIWKRVYGFNCLTKKKRERAFKQFLTFYPLLQSTDTAVADEQKNNSDSSSSLTCILKEETDVDREEINSEQERESTTEEKEFSG